MAKARGSDRPVASGAGLPMTERTSPGDRTFAEPNLAEHLAKSRRIIADARRMLQPGGKPPRSEHDPA